MPNDNLVAVALERMRLSMTSLAELHSRLLDRHLEDEAALVRGIVIRMSIDEALDRVPGMREGPPPPPSDKG